MAFEKLAVDDNHKTLRLALAMRGGVSLAVWIGGVVAEIDLFRRACSNQIHPHENRSRTFSWRSVSLQDCNIGSISVRIE